MVKAQRDVFDNNVLVVNLLQVLDLHDEVCQSGSPSLWIKRANGQPELYQTTRLQSSPDVVEGLSLREEVRFGTPESFAPLSCDSDVRRR